MKIIKFLTTALNFGSMIFAAFVFAWGWNNHIVPLSEIIPQVTWVSAWALGISFRVLFKDISWKMLEEISGMEGQDEAKLVAKSIMVSLSRYGGVALAWALLWILKFFA